MRTGIDVYALALVAGLTCLPAVAAVTLPALERTVLFSKTLSDCRPVDLKTWVHPTNKLLGQRGVTISKEVLCNHWTVPVFFVGFPFAMHEREKEYFDPLYEDLRIANDGHPVAFVSDKDGATVIVEYVRSKPTRKTFESFAPVR